MIQTCFSPAGNTTKLWLILRRCCSDSRIWIRRTFANKMWTALNLHVCVIGLPYHNIQTHIYSLLSKQLVVFYSHHRQPSNKITAASAYLSFHLIRAWNCVAPHGRWQQSVFQVGLWLTEWMKNGWLWIINVGRGRFIFDLWNMWTCFIMSVCVLIMHPSKHKHASIQTVSNTEKHAELDKFRLEHLYFWN